MKKGQRAEKRKKVCLSDIGSGWMRQIHSLSNKKKKKTRRTERVHAHTHTHTHTSQTQQLPDTRSPTYTLDEGPDILRTKRLHRRSRQQTPHHADDCRMSLLVQEVKDQQKSFYSVIISTRCDLRA